MINQALQNKISVQPRNPVQESCHLEPKTCLSYSTKKSPLTGKRPDIILPYSHLEENYTPPTNSTEIELSLSSLAKKPLSTPDKFRQSDPAIDKASPAKTSVVVKSDDNHLCVRSLVQNGLNKD